MNKGRAYFLDHGDDLVVLVAVVVELEDVATSKVGSITMITRYDEGYAQGGKTVSSSSALFLVFSFLDTLTSSLDPSEVIFTSVEVRERKC